MPSFGRLWNKECAKKTGLDWTERVADIANIHGVASDSQLPLLQDQCVADYLHVSELNMSWTQTSP
jgi:hypothetical protein